jgi:linoleoyl-CoA desaturase
MSKVTFNNKNNVFYETLNTSVKNYFSEKQLKQTGNVKLYIKALTLIPSAIILYIWLVFYTPTAWVALPLCGLLGFVLASIGFNVMHDACHGSYSSKKWVNNILGLTLNAMGGNAFIWKQKHNIVHHTYTNIDGIDDDIAKAPVIRQCESQVKVKAHRYQHIYSVIVYALSSVLWVFLMDLTKYFSQKIHNTALQNMDRKEHLVFWFSKAMYLIFYVGIPIYYVGFLPFLAGFFMMHAVMGLTLAIVFQLAHVVEDTEFLVTDGDKDMKVEEAWAIHQVKTTANFATHNKIISWFVGGLNFQIEHHLFPRVSHVHYPELSKIVKSTCEKYGVKYTDYPTMTQAVMSHFRFMKQLGR